jgi:hypothetical protein
VHYFYKKALYFLSYHGIIIIETRKQQHSEREVKIMTITTREYGKVQLVERNKIDGMKHADRVRVNNAMFDIYTRGNKVVASFTV